MLEIKDLCVSYGAIDAVKGISLKVNDGEIVSLIGANGAGKTTTLHTITGLVPAKSGSITYDGHDLLKTHANKIVTLGMAHVPEGRHVFTRMSVQENLEMGAFSLKDQSSLGKDLEMVFDYFPRLKERRRQLAGTLSGGEQQMVAMGRALMSHPKTILMDEPSMGLSPLLVKEIFDIIVTLRKRGITVLLIEHDMRLVMQICEHLVVLENVGNLVCPAEFDTGAVKNAMILSVPEGDDKPLKYPLMFQVCDVVLINKIDVLPYFDFDMDKCREYIAMRNPNAKVIPICAKTGEGIAEWTDWLREQVKAWQA